MALFFQQYKLFFDHMWKYVYYIVSVTDWEHISDFVDPEKARREALSTYWLLDPA